MNKKEAEKGRERKGEGESLGDVSEICRTLF